MAVAAVSASSMSPASSMPCLLRAVRPDAGEAVGLQLGADRQRIRLSLAELLLALMHVGEDAEHVLHMVADLVRQHIGLREIAGRAEARAKLVVEAEVDIEVPVGRAVERSGRRARQSRRLNSRCSKRASASARDRSRPASEKICFQVSSVSASTVATKSRISSLTPAWFPICCLCGDVPIEPSPERSCSGLMPSTQAMIRTTMIAPIPPPPARLTTKGPPRPPKPPPKPPPAPPPVFRAHRGCSCSAAGLATAYPCLPSSLEKTLADPASIREMPPGLHFLEIPQPSRKFHTAVLIVTRIATNAPRAFAAMQQV